MDTIGAPGIRLPSARKAPEGATAALARAAEKLPQPSTAYTW